MSISSRLRPFVLLAAVLAGCGGSDTPPVEPVLSASQPVGEAGGQLAVDGMVLSLPANALPAETAVQIDKLPAEAGELARFRLTPAGQVLRSDATLRIDLPGAPAATALFWIVDGEPVLMPATRTGDVLSALVRTLGYASGVQQKSVASAGRRQPLAEGDLTGGELSARVIDCDAQVATLKRRVQRLAQQGDIDEALLVSNALQEARIRCSPEQAAQMQRDACAALQLATDLARATPPSSLPQMTALAQRLLGTEAAVLKSGADCTPALDTGALLEERFGAFLQVLQGQLQGGRFSTAAGLSEFQLLINIQAQCQVLSITAVCDVVGERILPDLLDAMRLAAFDACRASRSSALPAQLQALGSLRVNDQSIFDFGRYTTEDVAADIAYCHGPALQLKVFDDATTLPVELTDRAKALRALGGLGSYIRRTDIDVPRDGSLTIGGDILVTRCPDGRALAADLLLRRGTQVLARRAHDGTSYSLGNQAFDLVVARLLTDAGLDPAATQSFTLTLVREGGTCDAIDDDLRLVVDPIALFEVNVALGAVGSFAGTVTLETRYTVSWSTAGDIELSNCGFTRPPATCSGTESGSLQASTRTELTVGTAGELTLGRTATLQPQGNVVTGSETGTRQREVTGKGESCDMSASSQLTGSGPAQRAEATDWQLLVQPDGALKLTPGTVRTVFALTNAGQSTIRLQPGCVPAGTFTEPIGPSPSQPEGRLFATDFTGTVNPGDSVWQGEATRDFSAQGATCLETLQSTSILSVKGGTPQISCTATVRAVWRLVRQ